jgi:hypothetical protein
MDVGGRYRKTSSPAGFELDPDKNLYVTVGGGGRYADAVLGGYVFSAANDAAKAVTTAHATCTGFVLYNPATSGKYLEILNIKVALASSPGAQASVNLGACIVPTATAPATNTAITVVNSLIGCANTNVGLAYSISTLPLAQISIRALASGVTATGAVNFPPMVDDDVAGQVIVSPGCLVALTAITTAISVVASMTWREYLVTSV